MSGRFVQLGRQLRKLRNIVGGAPAAEPVTTIRRATQLAADLACEHADVDDAKSGIDELARRGVLDAELAERVAAYIAVPRDGDFGVGAMQIGRDLDRFLRSLESGASAPAIAFDALVARADDAPKAESTAAVTVSGRLVELEVRGGRATVSIDEQLVAMAHASGDPMISFELAAAPTSKPEVLHEPTGVTRVVWASENITLEIAPDFARIQV